MRVTVTVAVTVARVRMPVHGADVSENHAESKGTLTQGRPRF